MRSTYQTLPPSELRAILDANPVTLTDLEVIRDKRDPRRFYGVYLRERRNIRYRARVLKYLELGGKFLTIREAATAIVAWYKHKFGEKWTRAFRNRSRSVWRTVEVWKRVVWSTRPDQKDCIGWRAEVFIRGTPQVVSLADAGFVHERRATQRYLFPSRDDAKRAARVALAKIIEKRKVTVPALLLWRGA